MSRFLGGYSVGYSVVSTSFIEKTVFVVLSVLLGQRSVDSIYVVYFWIYSIDLTIYSFIVITLSLSYLSISL